MLDLPGVQRLLDADTVLLAYSLVPPYVWVVHSDGVAGFALPTYRPLERAARAWYQLLAEPSRLPQAPNVLNRLMPDPVFLGPERPEDLSRMLLGPVAGWLAGKRRVVVAPDRSLQFIPFGALPAPGSDQPLVATHEVVYVPSASALAWLRRRAALRQPADRLVAVLGDPVYDSTDPRLTTVPAQRKPSVTGRRFGVGRLPHSREEAEAILGLAPHGQGLKALDFAASRSTLTSPELARYRIVHLATHGWLDPADPDRPGLLLSLMDERGNAQDSLVRVDEIHGLHLPAELVVLSGCQTGLGRVLRAEGAIALPRAFLKAGASRVVASLWKVDDEATAELMRLFYREMLGPARRPPSAALRAAQLALQKLDRWRAPYYWAGFVLYGEWN